jgi:hypothetical protein
VRPQLRERKYFTLQESRADLSLSSKKGVNFRKVTDKNLAFAVKKLNHRPRKCLNYKTPHKVYRQALCGAVAT